MKAQTSSQSKLNILKKLTKPLNQKKNSQVIQNTLQKQKSKPNLTLDCSNVETQIYKQQKLGTPKNTNIQYSMLTPKTQGNQELFKSQKSDLKKTGNTNIKAKKTTLVKHQPIKKDALPSMKSPKSNKINAIQSQIYLASEKQKFVLCIEQSHLNVDLDTSITKTDHFQDDILTEQMFQHQKSQKNLSILQESQIDELTKTSRDQNQEIKNLKQKNQDLQRKLNKMKVGQQENRKKLRQRISTFNEEGQQMKALKQKVLALEKQISQLHMQNKQLSEKLKAMPLNIQVKQGSSGSYSKRMPSLKIQSCQFQYLNTSSQKNIKNQALKGVMIDESVMTSFEDSLCEGVLSFINGSNVSGVQTSILSNQKSKDQESDSYNVIPSLEIEVIKGSYQQKYRCQLINIHQLYKQNITDIENRYKYLLSQVNQIVKSQQRQLITLQNKLDQLYQKLQQCTCSFKSIRANSPTIETDQQKLKNMIKINQYKQKLLKKQQQIKYCHEQIRSKQIECKRILSQLDIQRIKSNLNSQMIKLNKQLLQMVNNQQYDLLKQQLKQEKQICIKVKEQSSKKQQLIKKLTKYHNSSSNQVNKKIKR